MITVNLRNPQKDYHVQESMKALRTNIQFCGTNIKAIALTSCEPNEGKSNVAVGLAESFAISGKRVILLDVDLRKSVLLGRYKVDRGVKGMSHFLSGQHFIDEVIYNTNVENMHIIFSGPVPPNPAELLSSKMFGELIEQLKTIYDYIIIDTPPLGSVIDSAIIAQYCDGVAMVLAANTVSYKMVKHVKEQLDRTGCNFLGIILNKVNQSSHGYYGYGAYYGTKED